MRNGHAGVQPGRRYTKSLRFGDGVLQRVAKSKNSQGPLPPSLPLSPMKKLLRIGATVLVALVVLVGVAYLWASSSTARLFARTMETHRVDFPIPYPAPAETTVAVAATTNGNGNGAVVEATPTDPTAAALERGEHLLAARYGCRECHGQDFGGGTMMDAMPMGRFLGPNLTLGEGGVTRDFTPADWDRAVRHGVGHDGRPLVMPAADFRLMSDQELADIVTFIRSQPPIDNTVPPITLGPVGKFLMARGAFPLSADVIDPNASHPALPPAATATVEFGQHLAATCVGCHKPDFSGGPIGGDPSWAPAANLTPAGVLAAYDLDQFKRTLREGVLPDGSAAKVPMTFVLPFAQRMTDVELEAIFMFLKTLPPRETVN